MYTLLLIDVSGVQSYLFGSNRLKHNIGASYLVEQATDAWVKLALVHPSVCDGAFQFEPDPETANRDRQGIEYGLQAELIYRGGGNVVLLFDSSPRAQAFARCYTREVLAQAPGLRVLVSHQVVNWTDDSLSSKYQLALQDLARKKASSGITAEQLGLSVTATCDYSGLPAVRRNNDRDQLISAEIQSKLDNSDRAKQRMRDAFEAARDGFIFIDDFDEYGDEDELSYLAVVHADGNGMGARKEALRKKFLAATDNRKFANALRKFSHQVNAAGLKALEATLHHLVSNIASPPENDSKKVIWKQIELKRDLGVGDWLLPFVPLVYGGDDVTFVCDGRIGLALATHYLREFGKQVVDDPNGVPQKLSACAGIAVVHNHFPFARAYQIAEVLCRNAKQRVRKHQPNSSALDWHFAVNGAVRGLGEIREQDYRVDAGSLTSRPLFLNQPPTTLPVSGWEQFRLNATELQNAYWQSRRNKVKELREVLRLGASATRLFRKWHDLKALPHAASPVPDYAHTGWQANTCVYFDAIEADNFIVGVSQEITLS